MHYYHFFIFRVFFYSFPHPLLLVRVCLFPTKFAEKNINRFFVRVLFALLVKKSQFCFDEKKKLANSCRSMFSPISVPLMKKIKNNIFHRFGEFKSNGNFRDVTTFNKRSFFALTLSFCCCCSRVKMFTVYCLLIFASTPSLFSWGREGRKRKTMRFHWAD